MSLHAGAADAVLPGAGLTIQGRLAWGVPLLACAVPVQAALLFALAFGGAVGGWLVPRALVAWAVLAAAALAVRWLLRRAERGDPAEAVRLARAVSRAWLRGEGEAAALARRLLRAAPAEPQAWRLAALVLDDPRAARRAESLARRRG